MNTIIGSLVVKRRWRDQCLGIVVALMSLLLVAMSAQAAEPIAIFHVGNSLTDQAYGMHDIAADRQAT